MLNEKKVIERAIRKAISNGWNGHDGTDAEEMIANFEFDGGYFPIIYSHSFAKALWGTEDITGKGIPSYKKHLQRMVIADNPIKYLLENL